MRRVVLWVPDWPVSALVVDSPPGAAAVLVERGRVLLASPSAKRAGVRAGMPTSTARHLCPELLTLPRDADREGRAFEAVLNAFDAHASHVICIRPGLAWAPARGPARWAGSEEALAEALIDEVADSLGIECQVGIATGALSALAAARRGALVNEEDTRDFLFSVPLEEALPLFRPSELTPATQLLTTLGELGIHTCGDLCKLGGGTLLTRFGSLAHKLHDFARAGEGAVPSTARSLGEVEVRADVDPPAERMEEILIPLRALAVELANDLGGRGLGSHILTITMTTEGGQERSRSWQGVDARDMDTVVERARWQLRGWVDLRDSADEAAPTSALASLYLCAGELDPAPAHQNLWGDGAKEEAAARAGARICSLLGDRALFTPRLQGGFDPRSRVYLHPWGAVEAPLVDRDGEWEGALEEAPSTLFDRPPPVLLLGEPFEDGIPPGSGAASGEGGVVRALHPLMPVTVDSRGRLSGRPTIVRAADAPLPAPFDAAEVRIITAFGPWPVLGRWWESNGELGPRCYVRLQPETGPDLLLCAMGGHWRLEGLHD